MKKFLDWLNDGVFDTINNCWAKRSVKQYLRELMFSLIVIPMVLVRLPIMAVRFFTEPLWVGSLVTLTVIYWSIIALLELTSGV